MAVSLLPAGDDPGVVLWEFATGKKISKIGHHDDGLRMAAFSPDGATLVSSGFDEHIGLWTLATGAKLQFIRAHPRVPYSVAFSPDGKTLASGGDNEGAVRLWDVSSGMEIDTLLDHRGPVHSVAFSPNGRFLVSGGDGIRIWELDSGQPVRHLAEKELMVTAMLFRPTAERWRMSADQTRSAFGRSNRARRFGRSAVTAGFMGASRIPLRAKPWRHRIARAMLSFGTYAQARFRRTPNECLQRDRRRTF